MYIDSEGNLGYSSSTSRFLQEISYDITDFDPRELYNLKPAQFKYDLEHGGGNDSKILYGLIAEDVKEIFPQAACLNSDEENVDTWSEREMITPMLALIQQQHEEIELLKQEVETLKSIVNTLMPETPDSGDTTS